MKKVAFISAFTGVLFAVPTYFILKYINIENTLLLAVFSGLLFYLLLFFALLLHKRISDKRYFEAEKHITSKIWHRFNGNFKTADSIKNANIYFTDDGIAFISLDKKPFVFEEVLLQNILKYETDFIVNLNIHTTDGRLFIIMSAEVKELFSLLKEHGWVE